MIERVCDNNIFVHAKTETMWRVELTKTCARLTDLASAVHTDTLTLSVKQELQLPPLMKRKKYVVNISPTTKLNRTIVT